MVLTPCGSLRPTPANTFTANEETLLLAACSGIRVIPRMETGNSNDLIWGSYIGTNSAWAGDSDIRFRAATGGALSALGVYLLRSGSVKFVLHVRADPEHPMRSHWVMSETVDDIAARAGSGYMGRRHR